MGLLSFLKPKKTKSDIAFKVYDEIAGFMVDYVQYELDKNGRESNMIKLQTTISGLFAAWYFVKNVSVVDGKILNRQQADDANEIIRPLFYDVVAELVDHSTKTAGRSFPEEETKLFWDKIFRKQHEKFTRYTEIIWGMMKSGDRNRFGYDLTKAITNDLFGIEFLDISLLAMVVKVLGTPCRS